MAATDTTTAPEELGTAGCGPGAEGADLGPVSFAVRISEDQVQVLLDCPDPLGDVALTIEKIIAEFQDLELPEYPDRELLKQMLLGNCQRGEDVRGFPLIMGVAPVPEQDGRLDWAKDFFAEGWSVDEETDAVDFWSKVDNRSVDEGDLLVTIVDPVEGEPGLSVMGAAIPVGKPSAARLRLGKGVREEQVPGGTAVYAALNGRIRDADGTISVDEIYQIKGNVDLSTGNLVHSGTVVVDGDVLEGATLEVGGDLIVKGMLEPCNITAGGSLSVAGGIVGQEGYRIEVGGEVHAKYVHETLVRAGGDVTVVNEIAHSNIHSLGRIVIPKGRIAGGTTLGKAGIFVGEAGGASAKTTLIAGCDPTLKAKVKALKETLGNLEEARDKIKASLAKAMMREESLTERERKLVAALAARGGQLEEAIAGTEKTIAQVTAEGKKGAVMEVVMYKEVRSGTTIQLGDQKTLVRNSILKPRIAQRREDRVRVLPMGEGNTPDV